MKQANLEALLGRSLTSIEVANLDLYNDLAKQSLESLLCISLCSDEETKTFDVREGYRTVFTDIFTEVSEVKLNGEVIDDSKYSVRQWDKRNGDWYNSIVLDNVLCSTDTEIEVTATWGFNKMPTDLSLVYANLFDLISKKNTADNSISSKQVEDFRITFKDKNTDLDTEFYSKYRSIISKYSLCDIPNIQHGGYRGRI